MESWTVRRGVRARASRRERSAGHHRRRRRAVRQHPRAIGRLWLGADYDDGWVTWINGVEVARSSTMPAGTPVWNSAASSQESSNGTVPNYGTLVDITAAALPALHTGDNVLAVGVWNTSGTSSDPVLAHYLVTGWNGCGEGPLGTSSDGTPRPSGAACP